MDRMKKILSSPINKRKSSLGMPQSSGVPPPPPRYFGVPLEDLIRREGTTIPCIVTKVCTYIQKHGIGQEGIFRVNGNSRVVDRLKASFEQTGDADLDSAGDVMSVAGLLKLFLRELPNGVISENCTAEFVKAQEECIHNKPECLRRLKILLNRLPAANYDLLKYLCHFLVLVSQREQTNKMNPMALGIVFGPNLFRCVDGIDGLREQGVTNQITLHFITKYEELFKKEGESMKHSPVPDAKKSKTPPPRPPPPRLEGVQCSPIPSPRKNRNRERIVEELSRDGMEEGGGSGETTPRSTSSTLTHKLSEDEYLDTYRSGSPFILDSDRSESGSGVASPLAVLTAEVVERTISSAVSKHLFGENGSSEDNMSDAHKENTSPVPAPRKKRKDLRDQQKKANLSPTSSLDEDGNSSVKHRIQQFEIEDDDSTESSDASKPVRQRPKSKAFELFETQGIVFTPASDSMVQNLGSMRQDSVDADGEQDESDQEFLPHTNPRPKTRSPNKKAKNTNGNLDEGFDSAHTSQDSVNTMNDSDDSGFGGIHRSSSTLTPFKRAPGPKNRRTPSRKSLRQQLAQEHKESHLGHIEEYEDENNENLERRPKAWTAFMEQTDEDLNHNATKPSINFLNIHHNGMLEDSTQSPDRSPTTSHKPYVPPLDLSILHEHGDGSDPILAEQGPSLALHKANPFKEEDNVMLSPRMSKLRKKPNAHHDTDVPPSPPTEQPIFSKGSNRPDDEQSAQIKQLTKKIQSCKKKIKLFEEGFEEDHGYRPSQSDKAARPEIKKTMMELAKARKELRRVKDEIESSSRVSDLPSRDTPSTGSSDRLSDDVPRMEDTLQVLLKRLSEKRRDANRSEDLNLMTRDMIQDEKLAVQKALLQFENLHGRPTTKTEKELMKPLYDRYRTVKRMLSKPLSPLEKLQDLQPVPEEHTMEFPSPATSTKSSNHEPIRIPVSDQSDDQEFETTEFMVTRDFGLLKDTLHPVDLNNKNQDLSPEGPVVTNQKESNLHELSVSQLLEEQQRARLDKKRLRKILREYEDDFFEQTGRKVQKEDRVPMDAEYHEYKQIKARLKLLDALLSKHDPTAVI